MPLLGAFSGGWAFLLACQKVYDPDTWWHLATGRWVVQNGLVPAHDFLSFATAGAPWVAYSWLPATAMYLVHRAGGVTALVLGKASIVAAAFVLAFVMATRARVHPWLVAITLALAAPIARFQFRERPQILMFALVALFFWILAEPQAERRRTTWIALGLGQLLWANVHGSYVLGIALVGALFAERALSVSAAVLRREPGPGLRAVAPSLALLFLVVALSFATPYGSALVVQTLRETFSLGVSRTFVNEEFQALAPARYPGFVAFAAATATSFLASGRRTRPYSVAVFLGFALLAFTSVRFAAIAAFAFASVLMVNLQPSLERLQGGRMSTSGRPFLGRLGAAAATLLLVSFAVLSFRASYGPGREARFGIGVNESRFPGPAVQFLARSGFAGNLFNSWVHGGYLLWHLPAAKDLVDGRAHPAQLALLERLRSMDGAELERWLAARDVRGALLTRDDDFLPLFAQSSRYTRAFFDDRAVVYLRNDLAASATPLGASTRFLRPEVNDPSYLVPIARGPSAVGAEAEIRRAVADAPESFTPRFLLGFFLEAQGKSEALDHYLAAARLNPGLAFAHYQLGHRAGALAVRLGRIDRVEPLLRDALTISKDDPALLALLGSSLYVLKKLPEAERRLGEALARAPDLSLALTSLGYLYVDSNRAAKALPLFERAVAAAPGDEGAAFGLALALHASGDRAGAEARWRRFLESFPASAWAPRARQKLAECAPSAAGPDRR